MFPFHNRGWRHRSPPGRGLSINRQSKQAHKLIAWLPYWAGSGYGSPVSPATLTGVSDPRGVGRFGPAAISDGANNKEVTVRPSAVSARSATLTLWMELDDTVPAPSWSEAVCQWASTYTIYIIRIDNYGTPNIGGLTRKPDYSWVDANFGQPGVDIEYDRLYHYAFTSRYDGSTYYVASYLNGILVETNSSAGDAPDEVVDDFTCPEDDTNCSGITIYDARMYNYIVSPGLIYEMWHPDTRFELYAPSFKFWAGSVVILGSVTWGHDTGVVERNILDYTGRWTGTGTIEGSGDSERIKLESGQYMETVDVIDTYGQIDVELLQNNYDGTGDDVTLRYRTGSTVAACKAAGWVNYVGQFTSQRYVQVRLESTL